MPKRTFKDSDGAYRAVRDLLFDIHVITDYV